MQLRIRAMVPADWPAVRDIYAAGIAAGDATFETDVPDWAAWAAGKLADHRFVAASADTASTDTATADTATTDTTDTTDTASTDTVVGWTAVCAVSDRCAYAGVVEDSVYVAEQARGRGIGRLLLEALISSTEDAGIWTIQTGIFPENAASLALHHAVGVRAVGIRERIGRLHGCWRDVVLLERRSPVV